jgi:two-component system copper resistance phosphate regulon response regulator CusR
MRILLVEDEKALGMATTRALLEAGYQVDWARDGISGYQSAIAQDYEAVILDIMLPGKSGLEILANLRAMGRRFPVLMLTALDQMPDKVKGLDTGADDYLGKPFDVPELLARLRALRRRDVLNKGNLIRVADLEINRELRTVTRNQKSIKLTRREYDLLEALAINEGRTLSRDTISSRVWQDEDSVSNTVEVFIASLRKKVDAPFDKRLIHTVYGFGYVLKADV